MLTNINNIIAPPQPSAAATATTADELLAAINGAPSGEALSITINNTDPIVLNSRIDIPADKNISIIGGGLGAMRKINLTYPSSNSFNIFGTLTFYNVDITDTSCAWAHTMSVSSAGKLYIQQSNYLDKSSLVVMSDGYTELDNTRFKSEAASFSLAPFYFHATAKSKISLCDFIDFKANIGGVIENYGYADILHSNFTGNSAEQFGGAIFNGNGGEMEIASCAFTDNNAQYGGAIENDSDMLIGDSTFNTNTATDYGGAILVMGNTSHLSVEGATAFNSNTSYYGGAIYINKESLENLTVGQLVTFSGNSADAAFALDPADEKLYDSHVFAKQFTAPFTQAYNNYDIAYNSAFQLEAGVQVCANPDSLVGCPALPLCATTIDFGVLKTLPSLPPECVPDGMSFCGWYRDAELTKPVNDGDTFFAGDELYPCFCPDDFARVVSDAYSGCVFVGDPTSCCMSDDEFERRFVSMIKKYNCSCSAKAKVIVRGCGR
ncbi:MAG: hypothetical protein LBD16_00965, partial [Oscillospiraceae bacterium]|nr:hypothetical protein [Oscillospiraceae bacterium]